MQTYNAASPRQQEEESTGSRIFPLLCAPPFFVPCHCIFIWPMRIKLVPKHSRLGRRSTEVDGTMQQLSTHLRNPSRTLKLDWRLPRDMGGTGRKLDWELGISRCKLVYKEWINHKVLLYSSGNHIQYPAISHNGKE